MYAVWFRALWLADMLLPRLWRPGRTGIGRYRYGEKGSYEAMVTESSAETTQPRIGLVGRVRALLDKGVTPQTAKLSPDKRQKLRKSAEKQIDDFMRKVGWNPAAQTDEHGWRWFEVGSALGRAGVLDSDDNVLTVIEAKVIPLPSDKELILLDDIANDILRVMGMADELDDKLGEKYGGTTKQRA
jgi:hypothetical protein